MYLFFPFHCFGLETFVIDPGHPSENGVGARSPRGFREVDLNWQVACHMKSLLALEKQFRIIMTRDSFDETVTNRHRAEIANAASASLMLRIHCDSGHGHGVTLYYPALPGQLGNDRGPSPEVCSASAVLASLVQNHLSQALGASYRVNRVKTDRQTAIGSRQGALTGSIFSHVPVVTIELGYLDNPLDESFLTATPTQNLLSEALAGAIRHCFGKLTENRPGNH